MILDVFEVQEWIVRGYFRICGVFELFPSHSHWLSRRPARPAALFIDARPNCQQPPAMSFPFYRVTSESLRDSSTMPPSARNIQGVKQGRRRIRIK
jgi:hypothetical protein